MERISLVGGQRAGLDSDLRKDVPVGASAFGEEHELLPKAWPAMRMAGERVPEPRGGSRAWRIATRHSPVAGPPKRRALPRAQLSLRPNATP